MAPISQSDASQDNKFIKTNFFLQLFALLIRFIHRAKRFRYSTTFKVFAIPVLLVTILYIYRANVDYVNIDPKPEIIYWLTWVPLFWHFLTQCNIHIIVKETQFKSLMLMMGLNKFAHYIANIINYLVVTLPTMVALTYIFCNNSFDKTPILTTIIIMILFNIQLGCLIFLLTSPITSTKFSSFLILLYMVEALYGSGVLKLAKKVRETKFARLYVFLTSISPFQGLRNYADSWIPDGGEQEFKIEIIHDERQPFDPEQVHIREVNYAIAVYMLAWSFILFFLAAYIEEIIPWKSDTEIKRPLFCFPSIGKKKKKPEDILESEDQSLLGSLYFERSPANRSTGVRILGLSKSFKSKPAVKNVTMRIFRGETTLLLGHNGSGKTTLMNMILGQLIPDEGQVEKCQSKTNIGVCPQNSIYDMNLTVEQHLRLLILIKGYKIAKDQTFDMVISRTLRDIGLCEHRYKLPNELSGGMLRKLSLGMALVGESDILVLDEPSSGLDPDSRVFIWNAIRRSRANKTVFLSSQHMEEADYLGDRIAVMSEGRVVCCGSSLFLKGLFGSGYRLRVECRVSCIEKAIDVVRLYFPRAKLFDDDVYAQTDRENSDPIVSVSIRLSQENTSIQEDSKEREEQEDKLIQLLEYLESDNSLIKSHGLRASSIEDVLLNTNRYFKESRGDESNSNQGNVNIELNTIEDQIDSIIQVPLHAKSQSKSLIQTLMFKNLYYFKYETWSSINMRLIIPILALYMSIKDVDEDYPGTISGYNYSAIVQTAQLSLAMSAFSYYPTHERVSKFKSMLLASDANYLIYWLAHLLFDVISSSIVFMIVINIFLATLVKAEPQGSIILLHLIVSSGAILYLIAGSILAYLISMMFENAQSSLTKTMFLLQVNNYLYMLLAIIKLTKFPSETPILDQLQIGFGRFFATIVPADSFAYILYGLRSEGYYVRPDDKFPDQFSPIIWGFIGLILQIVAYASLIVAIESSNISLSGCLNLKFIYKSFIYLFSGSKSKETLFAVPDDEDVMLASSKALTLIKRDSDKPDKLVLIAGGLCKSYMPGEQIINHLSFTVDRGECFGLLGVNGAGKTTTFGMLTAETHPDKGRLWLNHIYNDMDLSLYRSQISYDPQVNPEIALTPTEALVLMAKLRRVKEEAIQGLVSNLIQILDMTEHANKSMKKLSGGTKRKLTLAMSLIGNPSILALDEPTAGVDPIARRKIWLLLRTLRTKNNVSIIISSHAMEECEAICDRISIMSKGKLRCLGSFLHLQSKYAVGCIVRISLTDRSNQQDQPEGDISDIVDDLKDRLEKEFPSAVKLDDKNDSSAVFSIECQLKRSILLKMMRKFGDKFKNINYIINDTSLEDVFKRIANENSGV